MRRATFRSTPSIAWRQWRGLTALVVTASLIFGVPSILPAYWVQVGVVILVWAVLASGLNILAGFCGLLDLGYVAFFTVGAYFSAIVSTEVVVGNGLTTPWWLFPSELLVGGLLSVYWEL